LDILAKKVACYVPFLTQWKAGELCCSEYILEFSWLDEWNNNKKKMAKNMHKYQAVYTAYKVYESKGFIKFDLGRTKGLPI
jgi:hypothetical protein